MKNHIKTYLLFFGIIFFNSLLYSDPSNDIQVLNTLFKQKKFAQTESLCKKIIKETDNLPENQKYNILIILGKSQYELWKPESAIKSFSLAAEISTNKNKEIAVYNQAKIYFITKNYKKSEELYNKLLQEFSESKNKPEYYFYFAKSLKYQNNIKHIKIFKKIIKEYPKSKYKRLSVSEL